MEKKQTAVQWLDNELWSLRLKLRGGEITIGQYNEHQIILIKQALQMEREQIGEAWGGGTERNYDKFISGEDYCTQTFKP